MVFQGMTQGTQFLGNVTKVNTISASKQTKFHKEMKSNPYKCYLQEINIHGIY